MLCARNTQRALTESCAFATLSFFRKLARGYFTKAPFDCFPNGGETLSIEEQGRIDLAAAYRICDYMGYNEGMSIALFAVFSLYFSSSRLQSSRDIHT